MGIYTDLSIFGIRIYNVSYDDDIYITYFKENMI